MAAKHTSKMRERARERANARRNQVAGGTTLRMPEGMTVEFFKPSKTVHNLDVLPYLVSDDNHPDKAKPGEQWHSRRYFYHRNVGAEENSYVCPAKTFGDPCPICEYAKQRKNEGATKEELDELRPKERQLFNVIDLDADPNKIMLWDISYHLFGKKLDIELTEGDEEYGGFAELEDGFTLKIRFEKKTFNKNEYFECDRIDFKKRKEDYDEDILGDTVPLDDILVHMSYKDLEKIFIMGSSEDEDGGEDRSSKKRRRDAEEDEQEEAPRSKRRKAEPEEESEEPEEAPKRRRSSKSEDEEPEAEEPPKRRRRSEPEPEEEPEEKPKRRRSEPEEDETPKRRRREPDPEPEDEAEEEPPKRRGSKGDDDGGGTKCSYGHKFGKDTDNHDDCDACKKWGACNAAKKGK